MNSVVQQPGAACRPALGAAVRQLMDAADACGDLLKCCRVEDGATCLHRARQYARERLCRTCRLVKALESIESAVS